ncbi:30S ribosomal protein S7p/S5e [Helicostylum pulchrum]|uniref:Small ribosomal subunit protein uS7 domain-containing protein n=1 Tax=Helicostylum pulchrum TaxID=562976 RepID=A0ABP9YEF4_9FUNG|nr:30S ribosomal protein S7p/S5e [Helicostylum pulchrum]
MSSTILQTLRQNGSAMRKFTPTLFRTMSTVAPTITPTPIVSPPASSEVPIVPNNEVVSQLVNTLMRDGKKARAQRLVSDSMNHLTKKLGAETDAYAVLLESIESASPLLKLSSTKKGSKVVHVPTALRDRQRRRRAIVWMLDAAKKRGEKSFEERFAAEVFDVSQGTSLVLQKKQQVHKQALANRANAQVSYNTQR